jgi:hypothetical protein
MIFQLAGQLILPISNIEGSNVGTRLVTGRTKVELDLSSRVPYYSVLC